MHPHVPNRAVLSRTVCIVALASLAPLGWALAEPADAGAAGARLERAERALVRVVNRKRARHGIPALSRDRRLQRAADRHCADMLGADFFAHTSSDGTPMSTRVLRYRASRRVGEALASVRARGPRRTARTVVRMWMRSPSHRAAVLSPDYRRIGVARRTGRLGSRRATVYTADFASRR